MTSKAQALQEAADVLADVRAIVAQLTPREAAERAWHPGGPPVEVLERQIAETGLCTV